MKPLNRSTVYLLFFVILLSTEFYYINMLGGSLRIYHLFTPVVILSHYRFIPLMAKTKVFWALIGFLLVNALAAEFSEIPSEAYLSLGLLATNMSIAFAVALILISGHLNLEQVIRIALFVAIVGIMIGIVQLAVFKLDGLNWGLSESQQIQVIMGFSSGFRTEANAFAKNLNVVFLLMLPTLLENSNRRRSLLIACVLLLGMLTSLTRSALYGLSITLVITYLWYQLSSRRGRLIAPRTLAILAIGGVMLFSFTAIVDHFNTYSAYKFSSFFSPEEILHGSSSSFRLKSQKYLWDAFLTSDKTFWLGNGWGQVRFFAFGREFQAGGAETLVALGYGGVLGGLFYFLYQFAAIINVRRTIGTEKNSDKTRFLEGVLMALIGVLVTGQINGSLIAPEYWMLFGMAMAVSVKGRARPQVTGKTMPNVLRGE